MPRLGEIGRLGAEPAATPVPKQILTSQTRKTWLQALLGPAGSSSGPFSAGPVDHRRLMINATCPGTLGAVPGHTTCRARLEGPGPSSETPSLNPGPGLAPARQHVGLERAANSAVAGGGRGGERGGPLDVPGEWLPAC